VRAAQRLIDGLAAVAGWVGCGALAALLLILLHEVVARYAFNAPSVWGSDLATLLTASVFLLGAADTLRTGGHVRIDVLSSRLRPRAAHLLQAAALALLVLPALLVVDIAAWQRTLRAVQRHEIDLGMAWQVPVWPTYGLIATGLGLLALQVAAEAARHGRAARRP
jgi:TRAP-type C4-dicarboxylate transport system permease small subunit